MGNKLSSASIYFYFHSLKSQYQDLKGKKKRVAQGVLGLIPQPDLSASVPTTLSQSCPPPSPGSFREADHARLSVKSVCRPMVASKVAKAGRRERRRPAADDSRGPGMMVVT